MPEDERSGRAVVRRKDRAVAAEHESSFAEETADGASYRLRLVAPGGVVELA